MEIELKYHVEKDTAEKIFQDEEILVIADKNSEETIDMHAIYFDTEDRRLSREGMTFRTRRENALYIATLKWNGTGANGLHEREEINVPLSGESEFNTPNMGVFEKSDIYETLKNVIGKRELLKRVEVKVTRRQIRIDTGKSICEISYDEGKVFNNDKNAPISEMEIELYSGSKEDMENFGEKIAEKYGIFPENRSKFKQGLELNP